VLCAVSCFCSCRFRLVVVDVVFSVVGTVLVVATGKSAASTAAPAESSFRLVASFHPACLRYVASNCVVR
jgi:hypothetical protein